VVEPKYQSLKLTIIASLHAPNVRTVLSLSSTATQMLEIPVISVSVIDTNVVVPIPAYSPDLPHANPNALVIQERSPQETITATGDTVVYKGQTLTLGGAVATDTSLSAVMSYGPSAIIVQYPAGSVSTIPVKVVAAPTPDSGSVIASVIDGIANGSPGGPLISASSSVSQTKSSPAASSTTPPSTGSSTSSSSPSSSGGSTCIEGTGDGNFEGLCSFSCHYGVRTLGTAIFRTLGSTVCLFLRQMKRHLYIFLLMSWF
jgi:hypothetical protein